MGGNDSRPVADQLTGSTVDRGSAKVCFSHQGQTANRRGRLTAICDQALQYQQEPRQDTILLSGRHGGTANSYQLL